MALLGVLKETALARSSLTDLAVPYRNVVMLIGCRRFVLYGEILVVCRDVVEVRC